MKKQNKRKKLNHMIKKPFEKFFSFSIKEKIKTITLSSIEILLKSDTNQQ